MFLTSDCSRLVLIIVTAAAYLPVFTGLVKRPQTGGEADSSTLLPPLTLPPHPHSRLHLHHPPPPFFTYKSSLVTTPIATRQPLSPRHRTVDQMPLKTAS